MNADERTNSLRSNVVTVASTPGPAKSRVANEALAESLDRHTTVGSLWKMEGDRIRCFACGHRCLIGEGRRGVCKVRFHQGGRLLVPFGYVAALQCDPVEKKPFFHHPLPRLRRRQNDGPDNGSKHRSSALRTIG